jgi:pilus assembly protein CpaE
MKSWFQIGRPKGTATRTDHTPELRSPRFRAFLIAPNRTLGGQLLVRAGEEPDLEIVHQLDSYPPLEALASVARAHKPDIVFLDLSSDLDTACGLIQSLASLCPNIFVIGLDESNDSETLIRALRVGATEFLHAPFQPDEMRGALTRIDRLRRAGEDSSGTSGRVIAFSSAKPGAGATTLATQTALALHAATGRRVLLVDLNLEGGLVGTGLTPSPRHSVLDGIERGGALDATQWSALTEYAGHIEVLAAPQVPYDGEVDSERLHALLASARQAYDWIVLDLPTVFDSRSLLALAEADRGFIVTTTELASLHLARRAADRLRQCGFGGDRYHILANRAVFSTLLDQRVMCDVLRSQVFATIPNDYRSLHELPRFGDMPRANTELGASLRRLAALLAGARSPGSGAFSPECELRPAVAR